MQGKIEAEQKFNLYFSHLKNHFARTRHLKIIEFFEWNTTKLRVEQVWIVGVIKELGSDLNRRYANEKARDDIHKRL